MSTNELSSAVNGVCNSSDTIGNTPHDESNVMMSQGPEGQHKFVSTRSLPIPHNTLDNMAKQYGLIGLPVELRLHIWDAVMWQTPTALHSNTNPEDRSRCGCGQTNRTEYLAILRVCKALNKEALSDWHERISYDICARHGRSIVGGLSQRQRSLIKHIFLRIYDWIDCNCGISNLILCCLRYCFKLKILTIAENLRPLKWQDAMTSTTSFSPKNLILLPRGCKVAFDGTVHPCFHKTVKEAMDKCNGKLVVLNTYGKNAHGRPGMNWLSGLILQQSRPSNIKGKSRMHTDVVVRSIFSLFEKWTIHLISLFEAYVLNTTKLTYLVHSPTLC